MFKRTIVPLDGTSFAEAALAPACELARAFGAQLIIARAVPPYGFPYVVDGGLPIIEVGARDTYDKTQNMAEATDIADSYLHRIATKLRESGYDVEPLLKVAVPGNAISRAAAAEHADLIVMSSHLRWKVPVQTTASATLDVLVQSRVPLLAWRVTDELSESAIPHKGPSVLARFQQALIVPLDGSPLSESAIPTAEELARAFGSSIVLVRAVERESERVAAFGYLDTVRSKIEAAGVRAQCMCRAGEPLRVIEHVWRDSGGGLVVMASRGKLGAHGTFFGSLAARMLELVEAPILVVRPANSLSLKSPDVIESVPRA